MLYPLSYEGLDCERLVGRRFNATVRWRPLVAPLACHDAPADAQLARRERTDHSGNTTEALSSASPSDGVFLR